MKLLRAEWAGLCGLNEACLLVILNALAMWCNLSMMDCSETLLLWGFIEREFISLKSISAREYSGALMQCQ